MSYRERKRQTRSKPGARDTKPRVLVFCEGQRTEPEYLRGFVRSHRKCVVDLQVGRQAGNSPDRLVREAKTQKEIAARRSRRKHDSFLDYDSVWCAFDVDNWAKLPEAMDMAAANQIKTVVSDPCFELWLLLHFRENPGPRTCAELLSLLNQYLQDHDKRVDFTDFCDGYDAAVRRAKRIVRDAKDRGDNRKNPCTDFYRLTEYIRTGKEPDS